MPLWLSVLIAVIGGTFAYFMGVYVGASHATQRIGDWMIANNYHYVLREFSNEFRRR